MLAIPSKEELNELFDYHPVTGILYWKNHIRMKGKEAGGVDNSGYIRVRIKNKKYLIHRIIWTIVHGDIDGGEIDHINGNKSDNRIDNLRLCSRSENCMNRGLFKTNKLGVKGVIYHQTMKKYKASISKDNKKVTIGFYDNKDDAYTAYKNMTLLLHNNFAFDHKGVR